MRCEHRQVRRLMLETLENRQLLASLAGSTTAGCGCTCPVCGQTLHPDSFAEEASFAPENSFSLAAAQASAAALTSSVGVQFRDDAATAGVAGTGTAFSISWIDYDADGDLDLWLGRPHWSENPNDPTDTRPAPRLLRNNGSGRFTNVFAEEFPDNVPGDTHGSLWTDLDNDGDADFIQTVGGDRGSARSSHTHRHRVYLQQAGQMVLAPASFGYTQPLGRGREVEVFDANRDGLADLFFSNSPRQDLTANSQLFLADASGYEPFAPTAAFDFQGDELITSQYNDVTGDGRPDLVSLDSRGVLQIHEFRGKDLSQEIVARTDLLPASPVVAAIRDFAIADFNRDGRNDLVITRREGNTGRVELYLFDPSSQAFRDATANAGFGGVTNGASIAVGDFDNDRDVDLFLSRENGSFDERDQIWFNRGQGTFESQWIDASTGQTTIDHGLGRKAIVGDYNNDGFLDVFLNATDAPGNQAKLHRNLRNNNHWLMIDLQGVVSAREAVGAKVEVTAGGVKQVQYQTTGKHHFAQNDTRLHFGLGGNTRASEIKITWPSGRVKILKSQAVDRVLTIREATNGVKGSAPRIVTTEVGAAYRAQLSPSQPQAWFRFTARGAGTLALPPLPQNMVLRVEQADGSLAQQFSGSETPQLSLSAQTYFLRFQRAAGATSVSYNFAPSYLVADEQGPEIQEPIIDDTIDPGQRVVKTLVSDARQGNAAVSAVKMWIDTAGDPVTTGISLTPVDGGPLDNSIEFVSAPIPASLYNSLAPGAHVVWLQAQDALGHWGPLFSLPFTKQLSAAPQLNQVPVGVTERASGHTPLLPNATVTDSDSLTFRGAEITVQLPEARSGDRLGIAFDSVITKSPLSYRGDRILFEGREIASYFGGWPADVPGFPFYFHPLTIRFLTAVDAATVNLVLQRIEFWNDTATAPVEDRTVDIFFHDGQGGRTSDALILRYKN